MTQKFHPLLFSTPMVQAILAGNKTMTRRVKGLKEVNENPDKWTFIGFEYNIKEQLYAMFANKSYMAEKYRLPFPYGMTEDILWVREKWAPMFSDEKELIGYYHSTDTDIYNGPWKPSIFMPKSACRLFLQIKYIRVERLHDISIEDAISEGIQPTNIAPFNNVKKWGWRFKDYQNPFNAVFANRSFESLWQTINGLESWNTNPWVWVIQFEKIEKSEGFL